MASKTRAEAKLLLLCLVAAASPADAPRPPVSLAPKIGSLSLPHAALTGSRWQRTPFAKRLPPLPLPLASGYVLRLDAHGKLQADPQSGWSPACAPASVLPRPWGVAVDDDVCLHLDAAPLLNIAREQPWGASLAQILYRSGLGGLCALDGCLRLGRGGAVEAVFKLSRDPTQPVLPSVLSALGPPVQPLQPAQVGSAFVAASIVPARAWDVLGNLLGGLYPLQYTLLRAQLGSLEQTRQQSLAADVLGEAARPWTIRVGHNEGGQAFFLARLQLSRALQLAPYIDLMLDTATSLSPALQYRRRDTRGPWRRQLYTNEGPGVSVALLADALVIANDETALLADIAKPLAVGRAMPRLPVQQASIWGQGRHRAATLQGAATTDNNELVVYVSLATAQPGAADVAKKPTRSQ